jgi:hypothetical protein
MMNTTRLDDIIGSPPFSELAHTHTHTHTHGWPEISCLLQVKEVIRMCLLKSSELSKWCDDDDDDDDCQRFYTTWKDWFSGW